MSTAAEGSLTLRFFNVGDGDSALLEITGKRPFRLLVDAGSCLPESLAGGQSCLQSLLALGADHLDAVIVTHLHLDHFGGLMEVAQNIPIGRVLSGYFPPEHAQVIPQEPEAEKTVRGLIDCLNLWKETVDSLCDDNCLPEQVRATGLIDGMPPGLQISCICPDARGMERQQRAWDRMFRGQAVSAEEKYAVSKLRNPASLIFRAEYAGRSVVLGADCFGALWEGWDNPPCDIFKAPHHGDCKSMTQRLADQLRPHHAVISCGGEYIARKDRPSAQTAAMLRQAGARVWYTGPYGGDPLSPVRHEPWLTFTIDKNGCLTGPLTEECE